jgi:hypothetical protein
MANPNILNISSVTLSSSSVLLPGYSVDYSNNSGYYYNNWAESPALSPNPVRTLLINDTNSNQLFKITSMMAEISLNASGVTIYTTAVNSETVRSVLYGNVESIISTDVAGSSTTSTYTYGPVNFGSGYRISSALATVDAAGTYRAHSYASQALICSPEMPFYLTEGLTLRGVARGIKSIGSNSTNYSQARPVNVRFTYEIIST